jgi:hypothetical protein
MGARDDGSNWPSVLRRLCRRNSECVASSPKSLSAVVRYLFVSAATVGLICGRDTHLNSRACSPMSPMIRRCLGWRLTLQTDSNNVTYSYEIEVDLDGKITSRMIINCPKQANLHEKHFDAEKFDGILIAAKRHASIHAPYVTAFVFRSPTVKPDEN